MAGKILFVALLAMLGGLGCTAKPETPAQDTAGTAGAGAIGGAAGAAGAAGMAAGSSGAGAVGGTAGTTAGTAGAAGMLAGGVGGTEAMPTAGSGVVDPMAGMGAGAGAGTGAMGTYDYENEMVSLSADLVIASGETVRVGPGTTFNVTGAMTKVLVQGTLIIEGGEDAQAQFIGTTTPRSWYGIVVESGGVLEMTHAHVGGALYGVHAKAGSDFTIDYSLFDNSFKAIVAESDGSIDHTEINAGIDPAAPPFSAVNEVSIEDVNGTLTIINASPTVSNSSFKGANAFVDMIRVGGNAKPILDHLHISAAHCGVHANGGTNNTPVITNSVFAQLAYGLMIYATKPQLENNVFMGNGNDIGFCFGATAANAPIMTNNFYSTGAAVIDPSCTQIGAAEPAPASTANPDAGPVGL